VPPDGTTAYVVNSADNLVWMYNIDPATGKLSPKTPAGVPTSGGPQSIVVSPDGHNAYVTDQVGPTGSVSYTSGAVSQYTITPGTDVLVPKAPPTVDAGQQPQGLAVTPDGASLYTQAAGNAVAEYSIDSTTGTLSPKTPASVGTSAGGPVAIAFGSLPRSCSGSNANCH